MLPSTTRMRWRRIDVPGQEEARFHRLPAGWRLQGEPRVQEDGVAASLRQVIECDAEAA